MASFAYINCTKREILGDTDPSKANWISHKLVLRFKFRQYIFCNQRDINRILVVLFPAQIFTMRMSPKQSILPKKQNIFLIARVIWTPSALRVSKLLEVFVHCHKKWVFNPTIGSNQRVTCDRYTLSPEL